MAITSFQSLFTPSLTPWLRQERIKRGLSQRQLGEMLNYSQRYISDIEGGRNPSPAFREAIARWKSANSALTQPRRTH